MKIKNIHIIINPAAGRMEPILPVINAVFKETSINWEVSITKKAGDGTVFAKQAVEKGVDAVAVYGGDGSIMEVIQGMLGSNIPLAILPGGSANVLAVDLNIPTHLKEACELICHGRWETKAIDVGQFGRYFFVLRIGLGFEAEMIKGADRETKNKVGRLAYFFSSMKALRTLKEVYYNIKIDGKSYKVKGLTCIIANSGNMGFKDLSLDQHINVSDGLLDVIVVRKANISLFTHIMITLFRHERPYNGELVEHWQGKDIHVSSIPKQSVQCDGEILKKDDIAVKVIPAVIQIVVPSQNS